MPGTAQANDEGCRANWFMASKVTVDQYARPDSDVSTGGWTTTPLWSKTDEGLDPTGDTEFIQSALNP